MSEISLATLTEQTLSTLHTIAAEFSPAVFASSLAAEDMVLTDMILRHHIPIGIFTLNTERLHPETLQVIDRIKKVYGYAVTSYYPDPDTIDAFTREHGINAFYNSTELRKSCCHIRKIAPLKRALLGNTAWLTGQRRAQSVTRTALAIQEDDAAHNMVKFNPLAEWEESHVWDYIHAHQVPYNVLHDQGFPSIGCAPCTRAVAPGEDIRAGRWWWESPDTKECGLHVVDGKLIRIHTAP